MFTSKPFLRSALVALALLFLLTACRIEAPEEHGENSLLSLVQRASFEMMLEWWPGVELLFGESGSDIPVAFSPEGQDRWALAHCGHGSLDGFPSILVWKIEGTKEDPKPVYLFDCSIYPSMALGVDIYEYDGKYLACGILNDHQWNHKDDTLIDASARSYLIIESPTGEARVPANGFGYICVLDSEPSDVRIYDKDDNMLVRVSDWGWPIRYITERGID